MANLEHLEILKDGIKVWNKWRTKNYEIAIDLSRANLRDLSLCEANLRHADLNLADLRRSDLRRADLEAAILNSSNLQEANLDSANLDRADLSELRHSWMGFSAIGPIDVQRVTRSLQGANLRGANLSSAQLSHTNLRGALFEGCNFSKVQMSYAILGDSDLSKAIGLSDVVHSGPSSISTDLLALSRGKIPEVFLRGCGMSDWEIESVKLYQPGLDPEQVTNITYKIHELYVKGGVQYYSCFISYNSKDEQFARKLHDDLQNSGVRCWFAPEDMKIGDQIRPRIDQEIRLRDKLLVILSKNSVKSEWVGDEVEAALEDESKSNRLVLFPIRLDDAVIKTRDDWAAKIKRRRHIGDFSNWNDKPTYQKAFERLLRDLKATGD